MSSSWIEASAGSPYPPVLTSGNLTSAQQIERFIANEERIVRACDDDGPFLYAVHKARIERMYPPGSGA